MTGYEVPHAKRKIYWALLVATILVVAFGINANRLVFSPLVPKTLQLASNEHAPLTGFGDVINTQAATLIAPLILLYTVSELTPPLTTPYVEKFSREHFFGMIQVSAFKIAALFAFILIFWATVLTIILLPGLITFNSFLPAARWLLLSYLVVLLTYEFAIQIWVLLIYLLRSKILAITGMILLNIVIGLLTRFFGMEWLAFAEVGNKLYAFLAQAHADWTNWVPMELLMPVLRRSLVLFLVTVSVGVLNFFISKRRDLL